MWVRLLVTAACVLLFSVLDPGNARADPPPFTDAELLALEVSGELLPPPDVLARIEADLGAIRDWDAYFEDFHVYPTWIPGVLLVELTDSAWQGYLAGQYHGLDSLNTFYGVVDIQPIGFIQVLVLTFAQIYNPLVLGPIYRQAPGVRWTEADTLSGDGDDIRCSQLGSYTFVRGWGDCPAGCMHHHYWEFLVEDGVVTLLEEHGDPVSPPPGACCLPDGTCILSIHWECEGIWQGPGTLCHPDPCVGTPTREQSWGSIKARFR